jgi:mannose-6-phosphate isomerase-like protein (cupin superfamily)
MYGQPRTLTRIADLADVPIPSGRQSRLAFDTGEIELRHFAPKDVDRQTPHDRDELYVVISGTAEFRRKDETVRCAPGDVLFVAAHEEHRFLDFSSDFQVWVIFYGPRRPT